MPFIIQIKVLAKQFLASRADHNNKIAPSVTIGQHIMKSLQASKSYNSFI